MVILFLLLILNVIFIQKITISPINIESFFPKSSVLNGQSSIIKNKQRILFSPSEEESTLGDLLEAGVVDDIVEVPHHENTSMVIFPQIKQSELLDKVSSQKIFGPPVVGQVLSEEFISDIEKYAFLVIPILFLIFILLTSVHYLFSILIEMSVISFLLLFTVSVIPYEINIAFLLSLVFIYIYAFTILNYFYYGDIQKNNLIKGIIISLLTTILSAFFLSQSDFIVISDFGKSLLIWIFILGVYLAFRFYFIQIKNWNLLWLNYFTKYVRIEKYILLGVSLIILLAFVLGQKLIINLNPISTSNSSKKIDDFEQEYILTQPILLSVKSADCSFKELECVKDLSFLMDEIVSQIPVESDRIIDFNMMYQAFSESDIKDIDKKKLAQFYLALEFSFNPEYLISADGKETFMIFTISIKESTNALSTLVSNLNILNQKYPKFSVEALSHVGKIQQYKQMFVDETFKGMSMVLGFIVMIFMFYYRSIFVLIVFIPAIITIVLFFVLHSLFTIPISLMSLVSLILFIGLIGDNIIHIFICYKRNGISCIGTVYKPIILSNVLMVLALFGMMFTGTLLQKFGLELGFLLAIHLFLLVYLLPKLARKYLVASET